MVARKKIFLNVIIIVSLVAFSHFAKAQNSPIYDSIAQSIQYTSRDTTSKYFLTKDEAENKDTIQLRHIPNDKLKKLQNNKDFWYANANVKREFGPNKEVVITVKTDTSGKYNSVVELPEQRRSIFYAKWFQTLLLLLAVGAFVAFIIVYLSGNDIGIFRKRNKYLKTSDEEEITDTEDIFAINYSRDIDKAIQNHNYRLAVRLMYLKLLKELAEKNIITYRQDKTNFDYLLQLNTTNYYKDFFRITRNYEYSWYGKMDVNPDAFTLMQNDFKNFLQQLN